MKDQEMLCHKNRWTIMARKLLNFSVMEKIFFTNDLIQMYSLNRHR